MDTTTQRRVIDSFHIPGFEFLSNFHPCIMYLPDPDGRLRYYRSLEHAYQAAKFNCPKVRHRIRRTRYGGGAKGLAKMLLQYGEKSAVPKAVWDAVKCDVMYSLLQVKFGKCNQDLQLKLLETGDAQLIEGNTWGDSFWGCVEVEGKWSGQNHLGRLLMDMREELRRAT